MINSLKIDGLVLTVDTLLFANDELEEKKNDDIMHIVQNYIKNSSRFSY